MNDDGYGMLGQGPDRPVPVPAHRLVWRTLGGALPENLHHVGCPHKHCVHPDHLDPLTTVEHALLHAAENVRETCSNGHPFDEANTYWRTGRNGRKSRQCRRCKADRELARRAGFTDAEREAKMAADSEARRRRNGWKRQPGSRY